MAECTLIRSDRHSLSLELAADGRLIVRAPKRLAECEIERFIAEKSEWILRKRTMLARSRRDWGGAPLSPKEIEELKTAARVDLGERIKRWATVVGEAPHCVTIRSQHRRWGSCSEGKRISLNALLMLAPEAVRDYVVVHELCHLKEMNHSPRFWAEVAHVLPEFRESRDWLTENGHALLQRNPT